MTDAEQAKELRDHAWKHFALHADQRLKTFNFYLVLAAVLVGGTTTMLKDFRSPGYAAGFAMLMALITYVFYKLDIRAKHLIAHSEEALKYWERELALRDDNNCPHPGRIFSREEHQTKLRKRGAGAMPWSWYYTYSTCFNVVFFTFGFGSLSVAIVLVCVTVINRLR